MKYLIFIYWALTISPESADDYIKKNMLAAKLSEAVFGVPASIQFAQALYESGGGKSYISKHSNNHFGIKYFKGAFSGDFFTDRAGGKWRAYPSVFWSYVDHAHFIWYHYREACYGSYKKFKTARGYGERGYWGVITNFIELKKLYKYDLW